MYYPLFMQFVEFSFMFLSHSSHVNSFLFCRMTKNELKKICFCRSVINNGGKIELDL